MERGHVGSRRGPGHQDRLLGGGTRPPRASFQTLTLTQFLTPPFWTSLNTEFPASASITIHLPPTVAQPATALLANLAAGLELPCLQHCPGAQPVPGTLRGPCHLHPTSGAPTPHSTHPRLGVRPPAQPHSPPQRSPLGSPPAHTLARARRRRPRRERRSRRNRRAASGTSTARSCRSRLWDRDRTSRSCEGTDGRTGRRTDGG